jgi:hypothetical protein
MSTWVALIATPIILSVVIGLAISWAAAKLPRRPKTKALVFASVFIVLFTPVLMPATIAGIFLPAMGIGLAVFWWHPWNWVSMGLSVALAIGLAWHLFLRRENNTAVRARHA